MQLRLCQELPPALPAASWENSNTHKPGPCRSCIRLDCGNQFTLYLPGSPARNSNWGRLVCRARLTSTPTTIGFTTHEQWVTSKTPFTQASLPPLLTGGLLVCRAVLLPQESTHCFILRGPGPFVLSSSVLITIHPTGDHLPAPNLQTPRSCSSPQAGSAPGYTFHSPTSGSSGKGP